MNHLVFDPIEHKYFYDGLEVPSVTTILKSANLVNFDMVPYQVLEKAAYIGTCVHNATAYADAGTLDYSTIDECLTGYLDAWEKFKKETGFKFTHIEVKLYSEKYKYAGAIDRIGTINGKEVLPDIKTGAHTISHGPQTAAYAQAAKEMGIITSRKPDRFTVQLNENGTYKLIPLKGNADFSAFLNALAIHNYKKRMR